MRHLKITKSITNRTPALEKYLQDIAKEELIDTNEEVELARRIKQGDERAVEKLTRANLRFVVSVAKQYQNQGLSLPDLINEGNVGLIKAARKFDETRGFKFISYAVWWIRQSMMQAVAEQSRTIRLPLNQVGSLNRINRAFTDFEQKFERRPTQEEIAELLELPIEKVKESLSTSGRSVSVDAPFSEDEDGTLLDVMPDEDVSDIDEKLQEESLKREIERALGVLSEREKVIIRLFYGLSSKPWKLEDIAKELDLTRERVRQIKERAIRRLRHNSRSRLLKSFL